MTAPVPPEAVESVMGVLLCKRTPAFNRCAVHEFRTWEGGWTDAGCPVAVEVAAAVVAALDLPGREREAAAKALDEAADADDWDSALGRANVRVRLRSRASALREGRQP